MKYDAEPLLPHSIIMDSDAEQSPLYSITIEGATEVWLPYSSVMEGDAETL